MEEWRIACAVGRVATINGEVRVLTIVEYSIFGFLLGSTLSGAGLYYYVVDEYRVSNELLSEDVYVSFPDNARQTACQHSATNIQLTRWFHTGTSIRRPEAGGLCQGSGAGRQVEEVGGATTNTRYRQQVGREKMIRMCAARRGSRRALVLASPVHLYTQLRPRKNPQKQENTAAAA